MEVLETSFTGEEMVEVPSGVEGSFCADQVLNFFLWVSIQVDEVGQETEHSGLLLGFFRKTVDQFDEFLDEWIEVVGQQKFTVLEDFSDQLPGMDTIF